MYKIPSAMSLTSSCFATCWKTNLSCRGIHISQIQAYTNNLSILSRYDVEFQVREARESNSHPALNELVKLHNRKVL